MIRPSVFANSRLPMLGSYAPSETGKKGPGISLMITFQRDDTQCLTKMFLGCEASKRVGIRLTSQRSREIASVLK